MKLKVWNYLRALILWGFTAAILLIWNQGFLLFFPNTWVYYRNRHYNKLTFSLLVMSGITYWAIHMISSGSDKRRPG